MTSYGLGDRGSIPDGGGGFFFYSMRPAVSGAQPVSYNEYWGSSPKGKCGWGVLLTTLPQRARLGALWGNFTFLLRVPQHFMQVWCILKITTLSNLEWTYVLVKTSTFIVCNTQVLLFLRNSYVAGEPSCEMRLVHPLVYTGGGKVKGMIWGSLGVRRLLSSGL
jgi:hypothetical protein